MRDGFIFYRSFYEASKPLNNDDKLALYEAIFEFALNQNETKREPMVNAMFMLIKPQLEANNKRYENGKNGGRPPKEKTETKPKHNQSITETKPKEKEKEKEKDNVKGKGCRIDKLSNSEFEDLNNFMIEHCREENISTIEIDKFIDYWKSTTKNALKLDWKATFRNHCRQDWVKKNNSNAYEVTGYE